LPVGDYYCSLCHSPTLTCAAQYLTIMRVALFVGYLVVPSASCAARDLPAAPGRTFRKLYRQCQRVR